MHLNFNIIVTTEWQIIKAFFEIRYVTAKHLFVNYLGSHMTSKR